MNKGNGRAKIIRFLEALFTVVFFMFIFLGLNKFNFLYKEPVQIQSVEESANKHFLEYEEANPVDVLEEDDDINRVTDGAVGNQGSDKRIDAIESAAPDRVKDRLCIADGLSNNLIDKRKEVVKPIPDPLGCNSR